MEVEVASKRSPRSSQEVAKSSQKTPRDPQEGPRGPQEAPRGPGGAPKGPQESPKRPSERAQRGPRGPQESPQKFPTRCKRPENRFPNSGFASGLSFKPHEHSSATLCHFGGLCFKSPFSEPYVVWRMSFGFAYGPPTAIHRAHATGRVTRGCEPLTATPTSDRHPPNVLGPAGCA